MNKREFLKITGTIIKTENVIEGMEDDTMETPQYTKGEEEKQWKRCRTLSKEGD